MIHKLQPVHPMLAKTGKLADLSAGNAGTHIIEPKLDGIRCLVVYDGNTTRLYSRTLTDITERFPEITIHAAARNFILDGEIICYDENGHDSFQLVQTRANRIDDIATAAVANPAVYTAFDILFLNDVSLLSYSFKTRSVFLNEILSYRHIIPRLHDAEVKALQDAREGEGVMVKDLNATYHPGQRSAAWLKVKWQEECIAYITGVIKGIGKRESTLGAIRIQDANGHDLGKVGTGFKNQDLVAISAYPNPKGIPVKIRYDYKTRDGKLRFPRFIGFVGPEDSHV